MASRRRSISRKSSKSSKSRSHSKKKRSLPPALKLWRKVAMEHGYMIKGDFRRIPKKGSKSYSELKSAFNSAKKKAGM